MASFEKLVDLNQTGFIDNGNLHMFKSQGQRSSEVNLKDNLKM